MVTVAALLIVSACGDGTPTTPVSAQVSVRPSAHNTLGASVSVSTDSPVRVAITATSGDHVVRTPRTAAVATEHVVPLVGMRASRQYALDVDLFSGSGKLLSTAHSSFSTGAIPKRFLKYKFTADPSRSSPGVTLVEVQPEHDTQYVMGIDNDGEIVWYYENTGIVGAIEPTPRGTLLSHYWPLGIRELDVLGDVTGNWQFEPVTPAPGSNSQADTRTALIDKDLLKQFAASLKGNPGDPPAVRVSAGWVELTSFHHDVQMMPGGNLLALSTAVHDLTPAQRAKFCPGDPSRFNVTSDVVVEFERSGRVVRTWDLWDAIDINKVPGHELCTDSGPFASADNRDWTHANSVTYDATRNAVIVSSRHTNQVIALRHLDVEGPQSDVLWIFGEVGTMPVEGALPYHQHAAAVEPDGSILLYDNGNDRPGTAVGNPTSPMFSRAVLYAVNDTAADPANWSVKQVWEYRAKELDGSAIYARFLGDADRLANGDVLITNGGIDNPKVDGDSHVAIVEVVPKGASGGDIVWDLRMGTPDAQVTVYRSERVPSLYFGPVWAR